MKAKQLLISLCIIALFLPSCYHYRVTVETPEPATDYYTKKSVKHAFLWGAIQPKPWKADDCKANGIDEVMVTTNFGYSLLTVLSLGIWCPMTAEWKCSKPDESSQDDEGL